MSKIYQVREVPAAGSAPEEQGRLLFETRDFKAALARQEVASECGQRTYISTVHDQPHQPEKRPNSVIWDTESIISATRNHKAMVEDLENQLNAIYFPHQVDHDGNVTLSVSLEAPIRQNDEWKYLLGVVTFRRTEIPHIIAQLQALYDQGK